MTTGEDNRFSIVEASFGPRIVIFESQDVVEACRRNGLEGFSSLVRPFEYIDRVSVRHSNYSTTVKDSLRLSFFSAGKLSEEGKKILDSDGQRERHDQDGWIKDSLIQNVFNRKSIDRWNSNMRAISSEHLTSNPTSPSANQQTSFKLKRENEWIGSELLSSDYTEEYPRPSTPWYNGFLSSLIEHRPLVQFDSTSHPIAALVVVSTNHPEPLNEFAKLYEASGKDGSGWPSLDWFESGKILRYYLLVHEINEEPDGGRPAAIDLLESLKRAYGLNCGLFCMNSENTDWLKAKRSLERDRDPGNVRSDDQPKKFDYWFKFNQNNQQHQLVDLNDEDVIGKRFGEFISEEDVLSLRLLLREFTLQSLIPHIERCVQQWNETLAASRKGITGRLFSVGRKYFSKASAAGSGSSTSLIPQSPTAYNPITQSYPHQSQEAQTRRLADYSFMLGDYKFASQMYDYVRKDARDDKAWSYCSSAIQMIGICTLLQSSSNQRSKLNVDLQSYLFDHLSIASSVGHLRMVMIYYEMSKAIGNPQLMSSSLIRASKTVHSFILTYLVV
ncbi:ER-golgi trafficking TRAPP I complex 85 kDa subunit-domain-containing protein [Phakopsora pachyrhizi]|uniref:ER-golgi trafficking TRAPP I complex 85 kDa subunit-domain-containing protein n=1 Tax=Phakopsora pachyrhizi TaxID=170000 RepID=A0AAV0BKX6_PHAPC|nr:ER-golgi trafficking TRAPP I complex 85 kDa subunit-domain-containing protein [Phakopsora pachyrhizi]